mmetsp:Transcript_19562/g.62313  ORF Transcript_19562/g.62313 Transcript_19562/m.62313 type:complete len:213 (+) Transcript_19562:102-740(+)
MATGAWSGSAQRVARGRGGCLPCRARSPLGLRSSTRARPSRQASMPMQCRKTYMGPQNAAQHGPPFGLRSCWQAPLSERSFPTVGAAAASGALALDVVDELLQLVFQARRLRRRLVGRSQQRDAKLVRILAHRVLAKRCIGADAAADERGEEEVAKEAEDVKEGQDEEDERASDGSRGVRIVLRRGEVVRALEVEVLDGVRDGGRQRDARDV